MSTSGTDAFAGLDGIDADDFRAAFDVFRASACAIVEAQPELRAARPPSAALREIARRALDMPELDAGGARAFFAEHFHPVRVTPDGGRPRGFLTGYYQPVVAGSLTPTAEFTEPLLARPVDLVSFAPGEGPPGFDPALAGARRRPDGTLEPYPVRAEIEAGGGAPLVWLADAVEVFMIQVQGSGLVELTDGRRLRLIYDGRNGRPYTSIGRGLIEAGEIREAEMSLARLKGWLRAAGVRPGERGRAWMQRNASYIFFRLAPDEPPGGGPIGGAGLPLTPLRSIAVDSNLWPYGLPFWIEARLPWRGAQPEPFGRLMIAQDTGSAILGAARADLFFGSGDEAGLRAGSIRHDADFRVLLPRGDAT